MQQNERDRAKLVNSILAKDKVFGNLCFEAESSYKSHNFTAALTCLFLLYELHLRYGLELDPDDKISLPVLIVTAHSEGLINATQAGSLSRLTEIRKAFYHKNHNAYVFDIPGLSYPLDETEAKKVIYDLYATDVFRLIIKADKYPNCDANAESVR